MANDIFFGTVWSLFFLNETHFEFFGLKDIPCSRPFATHISTTDCRSTLLVLSKTMPSAQATQPRNILPKKLFVRQSQDLQLPVQVIREKHTAAHPRRMPLLHPENMRTDDYRLQKHNSHISSFKIKVASVTERPAVNLNCHSLCRKYYSHRSRINISRILLSGNPKVIPLKSSNLSAPLFLE